jgi:anti-anti-sigma factor
MSVRIEQKDDLRTVSIDGEMTIYTALEYKTHLLEQLLDCHEMELNLSEIDEMDTAGLQILLMLKREAENGGRQLRLINHSRAIYEILELLNMQSHFGDPVVIPADWRM